MVCLAEPDSAVAAFPHLVLCISSSGFFIISSIINGVSLSSLSCSSKQIKPKEEIVGTPSWSTLEAQVKTIPGLVLASQGGRVVLKTAAGV